MLIALNMLFLILATFIKFSEILGMNNLSLVSLISILSNILMLDLEKGGA